MPSRNDEARMGSRVTQLTVINHIYFLPYSPPSSEISLDEKSFSDLVPLFRSPPLHVRPLVIAIFHQKTQPIEDD